MSTELDKAPRAVGSTIDPNPIVPSVVADAGEQAVAEYVAFLGKPGWKASTRKVYGSLVRRFLRWADDRGLTLRSITANDLSIYADAIGAKISPQRAVIYLNPVRGLFGHLTSTGVLASDPFYAFPFRQPPEREFPEPTIPLAELKRTVLEIGEQDGWQEASEEMQAALVMLAEFSIGTRDLEAISRFTGVPLPLVQQFSERLIANEIWLPDGRLATEWNDPENGGLAFMFDVWVALGQLERGMPAEIDVGETPTGPDSKATPTHDNDRAARMAELPDLDPGASDDQ